MIIIIRKLDNYKISFFCSFLIMLHVVYPSLSMADDVVGEVGVTGVITSLILSPHIIMLPPPAISNMAVGEDRCLVFNYKKIVCFCNKQTFSKYCDNYFFWYSKKICVSVSSCLFRKISILSYEKQNLFSKLVFFIVITILLLICDFD